MRRTAIIATVAAGVLAVGGVSAAAAVASSRTPILTAAVTAPFTAPAVSRERAIQLAQAQVPGSRPTETDLDNWRGVLVWEVELVNSAGVKTEVEVDATTGAIRKIDHDQDGGRHSSDDNSSDDHHSSDG
jgi:uncharacterized membrane protein YkoI